MARRTFGAEDARTHLPELLERAHRGASTVITKRGKPYAMIVPVKASGSRPRASLLALAGSGAGLWGEDSVSAIAAMRDEWT